MICGLVLENVRPMLIYNDATVPSPVYQDEKAELILVVAPRLEVPGSAPSTWIQNAFGTK